MLEPAYTYYTGGGYRYDPITHGPLQFHLIALSYTLFGDSDFSARIPDAVFGIGVILFAIFAFRKYLGRVGSLVAGILFTISPFISFYSRYTRNEIYIVLWGMALIWGVLRYLEYRPQADSAVSSRSSLRCIFATKRPPISSRQRC